MDNEFEVLREKCVEKGIDLNIASTREHVPEIERQIQTIKERVQALRNSLPFAAIPKVMVRAMVYFAVTWRNSFPIKDRLSDTLSPRTTIT